MRKLFLIAGLFLSLATHGMSNTDSLLVIRNIRISGNKITKDYIILRELVFNVGDHIMPANLEDNIRKSNENLMNISVFNFVTITPDISGNNVDINIKVTERWYIWPIPQFDIADRNFNTWWRTKDFSRVNYGVDLTAYNFRGRNETLGFLLSLGYDEKYGISYKIPYINKKQTLGLLLHGNYFRNHEVAVNTKNNKIEFFKDSKNYPKTSYTVATGITYRRNIHNSHLLQIGYENYSFADTLIKLNTNYSSQKSLNTHYLSFYYQFKNDFRDYKPYPLQGHYFDIEISKSGLGLLKNEITDFFSIKSTYRKFWKTNQRLYEAMGFTACITPDYPYYVQNGLGFGRDYVRGYEYYVISGQGFGLLKTNLKYNILSQKVSKINFIKTEKFNTIPYAFYVNLFADAAYVYNKKQDIMNSMTNSLLIGSGIGLDFVTYYDKVLRLEYSINKKGERGIFISFMTSI
jgi:outer membrane protein assembly factor BamA